MTLSVWYIRAQNKSHYVGSTYMVAKFSAKKKPSLFATEASGRLILKRLMDETYCDADSNVKCGSVKNHGLELREARIELD